MHLQNQKRLAAEALGTVESKVWFDQTRLEDIKEAITKADIRSLIKEGVIQGKKLNHASKVRSRKIRLQKQKGRRSGPGTRKGGGHAVVTKKRNWINHIRIQREFLKHLRDEKVIDTASFRMLYLKCKGGFFRSKRHLKLHMIEHGMLKNENNQ